MTPVRIAFYRPHKLTDVGGRAICLVTQSPFSHCELVVDGWCYSSSIRDGGVRRKQIDLYSGHWKLFDLPGADPIRVLKHFKRTDGEPYGWADLGAQQVFHLPLPDFRGDFCSAWCVKAAFPELPRPSVWHPGLLAEYVQLRYGR